MSLAALIILTGCTGSGGPAGSGGSTAEISTLDNKVCFNSDGIDRVRTVTVVDCAGNHDNEVYARFKLAENFFGAGQPLDDGLASDAANGQCGTAFEQFVGVADDSTSLSFSFSYPTSESWDEGDTAIHCFAYWDNGQVSGSLKDKGAEYALR